MWLKIESARGKVLSAVLLLVLCLSLQATAEPQAAVCPDAPPATDEELCAYLVSRSLTSLLGIASHRFIAFARYPGDPKAEIISYTKRDGMIRRTHGKAHRSDWNAWMKLRPELRRSRKLVRGVNASLIPAPVRVVRRYAEDLIEDLEYRLFGPNSNSYPQAIANRAAGTKVRVFERRLLGALGRRDWRKVSFRPRLEPIEQLAQTPLPLCPLRKDAPTERTWVATLLNATE